MVTITAGWVSGRLTCTRPGRVRRTGTCPPELRLPSTSGSWPCRREWPRPLSHPAQTEQLQVNKHLQGYPPGPRRYPVTSPKVSSDDVMRHRRSSESSCSGFSLTCPFQFSPRSTPPAPPPPGSSELLLLLLAAVVQLFKDPHCRLLQTFSADSDGSALPSLPPSAGLFSSH